MTCVSREHRLVAFLVLFVAAGQARGADNGVGPYQTTSMELFARSFEENLGQFPREVGFLARFASGSIAIRTDEPASSFVLCARGGGPDAASSENLAFRVDFVIEGWQGDARVEPGREVQGVFHYLHGRDPSAWVRDVRRFESVSIRNDRLGAAVLYRAAGPIPEFDIQVDPGAAIDLLTIRCEGADGIELESDGSLTIRTALGPISQPPPKVLAISPSGAVRPVPCGYRVIGNLRYGFVCAAAGGPDAVLIDPTLEFSTYLGAGSDEYGRAVALVPKGTNGDPVVVGDTTSPTFPTTAGVAQVSHGGGTTDAFVARLAPSGGSLVFATFLGGSAEDVAWDVAFTGWA